MIINGTGTLPSGSTFEGLAATRDLCCMAAERAMLRLYEPYSESKLLASLFITPMVVPYIIP